MKPRSLLVSVLVGASGVALHLAAPNLARAQSATTGAILGVVKDKATGDALAGVTVIATSPALSQSQTAITDDKGEYRITDLPPGDYLVTFYYADITVERSGIHVGVGKTAPVYQDIDQTKAGGETIHVTRVAPTIDPTSTNQGITLDKNYLKNIPVPGRTFDQMLGAAAGSQGDPVTGGVSFSGSTSLENEYVIDGVNTTGLTYGTVGSPIINDFIEEIEVITGGYDAEFGHSTGGVVQVVTKTGSNEFKGSIFATWQPGQLTAATKVSPVNATSIDATANEAYYADFGFELGGPIIKDKLWFFIGFAPSYNATDIARTVKSQTDCRVAANPAKGIPEGDIPGLSPCDASKYEDGVPDIDPRTGFYITSPIETTTRTDTAYNYNAIAKINYAATPEHQGQITFSALPSGTKQPGIFGPAAAGYQTHELTTDLSAKWTSKFNDNKTEVEAIIAWHHDHATVDALDPSDPQYGDSQVQQVLEDGSLGVWAPAYGENPAVVGYGGCKDGAPGSPDPYPLITNCPMQTRPYIIGGPGTMINDSEDRKMAQLNITHRLKAAGNHEFKAGVEIEDNSASHARLYSGNTMSNGGAFVTNDVDAGEITVDRWAQLAPMGTTDPRYQETCYTPNPANPSKELMLQCAYLGGAIGDPGTQVQTSTLNWAAYARDSWQIRPNFTVNLGLRYEEQYLRYANQLQNTIDPLTGNFLGTNAMELRNNWAPRIGVLYDWTKEGRSKIYAHWGRFFESIPMDINNRSFGGEVTYEQVFSAKSCGGATNPMIGGVDGLSCTTNASAQGDLAQHLIGASGELIAPGTQAQYMDEIVAGFEYEILDDLKIGVSYQNRNLGRVVEDISTDGANTYIIANPGTWSQDEQNSLESQIARTDDPTQKARLQNQLTEFEGIRNFDKPSREYNALQFTITRRFSKALYVQGSYTYSRTEGNYPGLVSYDNGQVDPNISSEFDLIELLSNRLGALPQDRPHYLKLDGYYTFDLKKAGDLTVGVRFRALSGTPEEALAGHYLYGPDESFLLPRGELGRTDFDHGLDVHIGYGKNLNKNMKLEVYADLFNIYNRQGTAAIDQTYAPYYNLVGLDPMTGMPVGGQQQNANPVSGGTYQDLIWVKSIDQNGNESSRPIGRNPDFGNTVTRYAPAALRIGARLTF
ncbi:MAG TPA: TonB-dependent receptor [Kofleriaceae bacterium]|jgi:outer membrane receptor protein involved in Fe transport